LTDTGSFDGPIEADETVVVESFVLEWHPASPDELKQLGHSGSMHVLPDLPVEENDIVLFDGHRYRVTDLHDQSLFGTVTHKVVRLERIYRG
jgi:hypothetical protein